MDTDQFKQLARKYLNSTLSGEELQKFLHELETREEEFNEVVDQEVSLQHSTDFDQEGAFRKLMHDERFSEPRMRPIRPAAWLAVACSVLMALGLTFYFNQRNAAPAAEPQGRLVKLNPVSQGEGRQTEIRLADGTELALSDIGEQAIHSAGLSLSRVSDGVYKLSIQPGGAGAERTYHEFSTTKGISYALMLPDGSKVELNSGSTLRLDPRFNVSNRDCELSGEAYFDVNRNEKMAFRVKTRHYDVKVLGTRFNVKSYPQSNYSQTALIQGSVHVSKGSSELKLAPGEQANAGQGQSLGKSQANLREVLAWKEGYFRFTEASIERIMEDIAAWYDVDEVEYRAASEELFTGSIVRTRDLHDVLKSIEQISDLRFQIKERRVVVGK